MWHEYIKKQHGPTERKFEKIIRKYLKEASQRYARRLKAAATEERVYKNMEFETIQKAAIVDYTELLSIYEEKRILMETFGKTWKEVWTQEGIEELKKIFKIAKTPDPANLIGGWSTYSEEFATGADEYIENMVDEVVSTTTKDMRKLVQDGLNEGLSIDSITDRIVTSKKFDPARARLIARTEATRVHTGSTVKTIQDANRFGVRTKKVWLSNRDQYTRQEHWDLGSPQYYGVKSKAIEADELFKIGKYSALNPGEFGEPEMDCNCRCSVRPVVIR